MTEYLIATSVLEAIVRGSLANDDRVRLRGSVPLLGSHPAQVTVDDDTCHVVVQVDARFGEVLPPLAVEVRHEVATALGHMTGLRVSGVDVVFSGVFQSAPKTPDSVVRRRSARRQAVVVLYQQDLLALSAERALERAYDEGPSEYARRLCWESRHDETASMDCLPSTSRAGSLGVWASLKGLSCASPPTSCWRSGMCLKPWSSTRL